MPYSLYVGRLRKILRRRDVRKVFVGYGRMLRCDVKYGTEMAYAFIDYENRESAEECIKKENGREIFGQNMIVEWATGRKGERKKPVRRTSALESDVCFRCCRLGHWARDCTEVGRFGRKGGGGGCSHERSSSPINRSKSRNRRRRHHSRSHDRRRYSRSNEKRSHSCSGRQV